MTSINSRPTYFYFFFVECIVSRMDLWFLIDGSGSIGLNNFETCLRFVNETASNFVIAPDRIRTGLMIYSSSITTRSFFNQHQTNDEFSSTVLSTPYPSGLSIFDAYLQFFDKDYFFKKIRVAIKPACNHNLDRIFVKQFLGIGW